MFVCLNLLKLGIVSAQALPVEKHARHENRRTFRNTSNGRFGLVRPKSRIA